MGIRWSRSSRRPVADRILSANEGGHRSVAGSRAHTSNRSRSSIRSGTRSATPGGANRTRSRAIAFGPGATAFTGCTRSLAATSSPPIRSPARRPSCSCRIRCGGASSAAGGCDRQDGRPRSGFVYGDRRDAASGSRFVLGQSTALTPLRGVRPDQRHTRSQSCGPARPSPTPIVNSPRSFQSSTRRRPKMLRSSNVPIDEFRRPRGARST